MTDVPKDDGDPLLSMAVRLEGGLRRVTAAIQLETRTRRLGTFIMSIALIIAVVGAAIGIYSAISARSLANCTSDWANAYQSRASSITIASSSRVDAQNDFNLATAALANTIPTAAKNPTAFEADLAQLIKVGDRLKKADAAYNAALKKQPLSKVSNKLHC